MRVSAWVVGLCLLAAGTLEASAQSQRGERPSAPALQRGDINAGTIGLISGGIAGTYVRIAADIASVVDDGDRIRVLPIIGKGSVQNLRDLLFMRGVDLALVQSDVLEAFRREGAGAIADRVRYVTRLYNEEVHILASRDVTDVRQLAGRPVNIDLAGSGTAMTARIVFSLLGVQPTFTNLEQGVAYERLRSGEIAAAVFVGGKPLRGIAEFASDGRFHLLPIPYDDSLQEVYLPAQLSNSDYPNLVRSGAVDTIAVGTVLAAFNWAENNDRYQRLARFVDRFFAQFGEFQRPPRHPKWQEVNLAGNIPGWTRFRPAADWLRRNAVANAGPQSAEAFGRFLAARPGATPVSTEDRDRLFQEFLDWQRSRR